MKDGMLKKWVVIVAVGTGLLSAVVTAATGAILHYTPKAPCANLMCCHEVPRGTPCVICRTGRNEICCAKGEKRCYPCDSTPA